MSDLYVLARIYKYVLVKTGRAEIHESFDKDYFTFLAMYQQRVDPSKQEDIESVCFQIFIHKDKIMASDQNPDVLQKNGYFYSEETFEDLFVRSFHESFINVSTDSSEELEEADFEEEEKKGVQQEQPSASSRDKKIVNTSSEFIP